MQGGCASTQLNNNTLDLASTTDRLLTHQVLLNLSRFIDNDAAVPAQLNISSGAASTTNSITPSVTAPLSNAVTATGAAAQTIAAATSTTRTDTLASVRNASTLSLNAGDTWTQNWNFAPVTDEGQLRRLRALYRYAIDDSPDRENRLIREYPLVHKSVSLTRPACALDANGLEQRVKGVASTNTLVEDQNTHEMVAKPSPVLYDTCIPLASNNATNVNTIMVPDEFYLRRPRCIVCLINESRILRPDFDARKLTVNDLTVNPNLKGQWLRWRPQAGAMDLRPRPPVAGDISIGVHGNYEFYLSPKLAARLGEFTLFVLAASTQADSNSAANAAGGASAKGGNRSTGILTDLGGGVFVVQ
jgi:hypothetical protein